MFRQMGMVSFIVRNALDYYYSIINYLNSIMRPEGVVKDRGILY